MYFQLQKMYSCETGWRWLHHKDGCSQITVQTLMKKKQTGEVKDMEFSGVLKKQKVDFPGVIWK